MDIEESVILKIKESKIYSPINDNLVHMIVHDCFRRFGTKDLEKKVKNLLHQIWGAYYGNKPNFHKIASIFDNNDVQASIENILKLHSSTKERLPFYKDFYNKIFDITGKPASIIDHACGLNPLSFQFMNLPEKTKYTAYDIDQDEVTFLNLIFQKLNKVNFEAINNNILEYKDEFADIIFMLKFLPVIEQQYKGKTLEILKHQNCNYLVISFPSKSISGKEKGMADFYSNNFENLVNGENWKYDKLLFSNEIVYIINRTNA